MFSLKKSHEPITNVNWGEPSGDNLEAIERRRNRIHNLKALEKANVLFLKPEEAQLHEPQMSDVIHIGVNQAKESEVQIPVHIGVILAEQTAKHEQVS